MTFTTLARRTRDVRHALAPRARRAATALLAAAFVAVLAACPGEINGDVDRSTGPGQTPTSGGPGTGTGGPGGGPGEIRDAFVAVSAGGAHTCALTAVGRAYCWGNNDEGQLGTDNRTDYSTPKAVVTDELFGSISAGSGRTCAITLDGEIWCWGSNYKGTIVPGGTAYQEVPIRVGDEFTWASVDVNYLQICGITTTAVAYCWGDNRFGQLGIGSDRPDSLTSPSIPVVGNYSWRQVVPADLYACGLTTTGVTYCWSGEGGILRTMGSPGNFSYSPRQTATESSFTLIDGGSDHMCGIEEGTSRVSCWGSARLSGSEGDDAGLVPTRVALEQDVIGLGVGGNSSCLVANTGRAWCWGLNMYGQLGDGTLTERRTPVEVQSAFNFTAITVGGNHACGIADDGRTYCWGLNAWGQLGNGSTNGLDGNPAPVRVL